jgi:enoyl-CoA hydratase
MIFFCNFKGPIGIKEAKKSLNFGLKMTNDRLKGLKFEKECYSRVLKSNDRLEGLKSFVEKRKPIFNGN